MLVVFLANGVVIGTWVVRIPAVQQRLGIGEGLLGVALLGAAVGALAAMPLVGALVSRFGSRRIVGATALMLVALLGFACAGAGFSIVFPTALSAAGRTEGMAPGPALAAVSTTAYSGFLVGPPTIGFLAELTGLGYALYLVVALSLAIVIFAGAVKTGGGKGK